MSNVINFSAVVNARRAAQVTADRDTARQARYDAMKANLADSLGGTAGAQIIAEVVTDLKRQDDQARPMPAYCDPSNEWRGVKYEATQRLSLTEIAARMRQDIKDALKAGHLPAGLKVSVRREYYSGGGSIHMRVTALPAGFRLFTPEFAAYIKADPNRRHDWQLPYGMTRESPEYAQLMERLKAIHNAYNRDNSDSMTDYFDRNYYGDAGLDWQLRRDMEAAEIDAATAE